MPRRLKRKSNGPGAFKRRVEGLFNRIPNLDRMKAMLTSDFAMQSRYRLLVGCLGAFDGPQCARERHLSLMRAVGASGSLDSIFSIACLLPNGIVEVEVTLTVQVPPGGSGALQVFV